MANVIALGELNAFRKECIAAETDVEAGYVNDPSDLGGETNHGITVGTAKRYATTLKRDYNWDGTMRNLTQDMAYFIYKVEFWDVMKLDTIASKYSCILARTMFRWGLKSGQERPVEYLQRTLNVLNNKGTLYKNIVADGHIGPATLGAVDGLIKARGMDDAIAMLVWYLNTLQGWWMFNISEKRDGEVNERFTWGWSTRVMREQYDYIKEFGFPNV